jgi:transketolase
MERFNREAAEYREDVLPLSCRRRVAIEAGVPEIWYQYVGLDGRVVGLHRFGLSAPGAEVMKEFGMDAQHVIEAAKSLPLEDDAYDSERSKGSRLAGVRSETADVA